MIAYDETYVSGAQKRLGALFDFAVFGLGVDLGCTQAHPQTNLQARRLAAGLSQSQLARAAGVPVRTLQQYEQRQKNINHARADYVAALARALGCSAIDLFEHTAQSSCEYAFVSL